MSKHALTENIKKVEEMVLDEEKLITYLSLSKELCLHVNESKSLLNETINYMKTKRPNIELKVSYILSGISEGNFAHTLVCNEEEAVKLRNKFFKNIFFDHVYSICTSIPEVDKVAYLAINRLEDLTLCSGLIKNAMCIRHSSDEIDKLKSNSQNIETVEQKPVAVLKKNILESINSKSISNVKSEVNKPISDIKKESPKKDLSAKPKVNNDIKNSNSSHKGIAGFFAKSNGNHGTKTNGNNKTPPEHKDVLVKQNLKQVKVEKVELVNKSSKSNKNEEDNKSSINKKVLHNDIKQDCNAKSKSSKSVNSALSQIKKNAKVDTKRKRVLHVSDSESEDDKNDPFETETVTSNNSDDEIPPTPTINTVKITSGIVNPKKRRKIVDKTYTDDEGYILTKKVEVYESCSENEEETSKENVKLDKKPEKSPELKKNDNKTKKKVTPPQKGKQSTLMNFFKKT